MKILEEMAKQFSVSEPVFTADLTYSGTCIDFRVKDPYKPNQLVLEDPIAKLIAKRYQETLRGDCFVQVTHIQSVYNDIIDGIIHFYEMRAPLKNPTQSRLYKWLRSMEDRYNHPSAVGFIGLYRYITRPMTADDVQNVLAILEMMREKYEDAN